MNLFSRLKQGLSKTRKQISSIVGQSDRFDDVFFENLEDALIAADIGMDHTQDVLRRLKNRIAFEETTLVARAYEILKQILADDLRLERNITDFPPKPWVILVVGVNGVGKTTTIGKLAKQYRDLGQRIILGAVDTFRAGAIEQLKIWAERTESAIVAQHEGADPASVAFDTLEAAKARDADIVILDTAGRLHNKIKLMNELEKIVRVIKRNIPHAPNEILLVVDATTGQNAIKQTEVFHKALGVNGFIITKLDGTAKGGIALTLVKRFGIPIRKIGVGEHIDDLQDFNPDNYIEAMFGNFEQS